MIKKYYLLSPGPTPVPDSVLSAAAEPIIHHRTPEFSEIFIQVSEGLKYVYGTKEDVFILTSSGSGAMETAIVNTLSPGDKVISINAGKFGERWGNIGKAYGVNVKEIVLEWGADFSKEQLAAELKANPGVKAVFTTLSETSSGAIYDIKGFGEVVAVLLDVSDQFLCEEGVARRRGKQGVHNAGGGGLAQHRLHQSRRLFAFEGAQHDARGQPLAVQVRQHGGQRMPVVHLRVAVGSDNQERGRRQTAGQVLEKEHGGIVCPVKVVQEQEKRRTGTHIDKKIRDALEQPVAFGFGVEGRRLTDIREALAELGE